MPDIGTAVLHLCDGMLPLNQRTKAIENFQRDPPTTGDHARSVFSVDRICMFGISPLNCMPRLLNFTRDPSTTGTDAFAAAAATCMTHSRHIHVQEHLLAACNHMLCQQSAAYAVPVSVKQRSTQHAASLADQLLPCL
jgi:hypothetical protein